MRAVKFTGYGGPDVLDVVEVPRRAAGPGQVVVAVVTAATNPGEIGIREGHFADIWPAHFPEGQGNDFAGYVAEIGSGVGRFRGRRRGPRVRAREQRRQNTSRSASIAVAAKPAGPVVGGRRDDRRSRGNSVGVGRRGEPTTR